MVKWTKLTTSLNGPAIKILTNDGGGTCVKKSLEASQGFPTIHFICPTWIVKAGDKTQQWAEKSIQLLAVHLHKDLFQQEPQSVTNKLPHLSPFTICKGLQRNYSYPVPHGDISIITSNISLSYPVCNPNYSDPVPNFQSPGEENIQCRLGICVINIAVTTITPPQAPPPLSLTSTITPHHHLLQAITASWEQSNMHEWCCILPHPTTIHNQL